MPDPAAQAALAQPVAAAATTIPVAAPPQLVLLDLDTPPPLPPDMQKMLDAAIASGSKKDIDTIARYIVKIVPNSAVTVNLAVAEHEKAENEARHDQLASLDFFDAWKGEGQLGASQSTGNSSAVGIDAGLALHKEGLRWRHKLLAHADYQRTDGLISRNQLRASYEPNYKFDGNLFAFGLAQVERDPFTGFDARYSLSGGLGYTPVRSRAMELDIKAGPAWRQTDYVAAPTDAQLSLLAGASYKWRMSGTLTFTQTADAVIDSRDKTIHALSALDSKLGGKFSARLSWQYNFESDPPPGTRGVDTLSRVSLVYGF
ncbi:MAG: DUF481 domain-containing protein [Sphingomonadales bacterium]|nr:DUF481 domain-containing protein [Sphingomonadales bacterium]MDE2568045.1 DUF481 domain-containing protein [Sphingomonadales bacterium]